jgi:mannose-6-phosphate isomerase-like protein (cupin superfamily)
MTNEYGAWLGRLYSAINFPVHPPFGGALVHVHTGESIVLHSHHEFEVYIFLDGQGTMQVDNDSFEIEPGDVILMEPFKNHGLYNSHNETLRFMALWWVQ